MDTSANKLIIKMAFSVTANHYTVTHARRRWDGVVAGVFLAAKVRLERKRVNADERVP